MEKIIGVILLAVAGYLAYMGYTESQEIQSVVMKTLTGDTTDNVTLKYIGALVSALLGLYFIKK